MCVPFSVFCVRFLCKCALYNCHGVSTQLQLNIKNIYISYQDIVNFTLPAPSYRHKRIVDIMHCNNAKGTLQQYKETLLLRLHGNNV
jgi:hypothetical protein